jgi:hypothetical protein
MIIRPSLTKFCVAASLCVFILASCRAQIPTASVRPQSPSTAPQAGPSSKIRPTGLEAAGGSIAAGVYTNSAFGFSLQIPPGWVVVPSDAPVIKPTKGQPPASMPRQTVQVLLVVTENAPPKKSYERRSVQVTATKLTVQTGPATAADYLTYSRKTAKEQGMAVEYLGDPKEVTIHGRKLAEIGLNSNTSGGLQHVEQYVTVEKGVLLQFLLVSPDEAGLKDLQPYIQSLRFKSAVTPAAKSSGTKK